MSEKLTHTSTFNAIILLADAYVQYMTILVQPPKPHPKRIKHLLLLVNGQSVSQLFINSFNILSISLLTLKVPKNQKCFKHVEVVYMIALRKGLNPQPMGHAFKTSCKNLRIQHDHIFSFSLLCNFGSIDEVFLRTKTMQFIFEYILYQLSYSTYDIKKMHLTYSNFQDLRKKIFVNYATFCLKM